MNLNVMKLIEKNYGKINPAYSYHMADAETIIDSSKGDIRTMTYKFFVLGYAQGMKAAKAEMKKHAKAVSV